MVKNIIREIKPFKICKVNAWGVIGLHLEVYKNYDGRTFMEGIMFTICAEVDLAHVKILQQRNKCLLNTGIVDPKRNSRVRAQDTSTWSGYQGGVAFYQRMVCQRG